MVVSGTLVDTRGSRKAAGTPEPTPRPAAVLSRAKVRDGATRVRRPAPWNARRAEMDNGDDAVTELGKDAGGRVVQAVVK